MARWIRVVALGPRGGAKAAARARAQAESVDDRNRDRDRGRQETAIDARLVAADAEVRRRRRGISHGGFHECGVAPLGVAPEAIARELRVDCVGSDREGDAPRSRSGHQLSRALPTRVQILVNRRIVADEREPVRMSTGAGGRREDPVAERRGPPHVARDRSGALRGIVGSVEFVRAEVTDADAEVALDLADAHGTAQGGARLADAIVRARAVPIALLVLRCASDRECAVLGRSGCRATGRAERAGAGPNVRFGRAATRDDIDDAAHGVGPVEG